MDETTKTDGVKMTAPEDTTAATVGDTEYKVPEDGSILAKAEHVAKLIEHGFVVFVEKVTGKGKK